MKATIEIDRDMFLIWVNGNDGLLCDIHVVEELELIKEDDQMQHKEIVFQLG